MKSIFNRIKRIFISSTTIGTKNFIVPAINILVASRPEFLPHWLLISGYFGTLLDLQQEKVNEFVNYIQNNSSIFTKEMVNSLEFKEGFVITFESYLKQRNKQKRKYIQNIFIGFTESEVKEDFELERMYDLLNKISKYQISTLKRIYNKIDISINEKERLAVESDYDDIKYLQSLGLLSVEKKQRIEVDTTTEELPNIDNKSSILGSRKKEDYVSDVEAELKETETFSLSIFGEDFVGFILDS